MASTLSPAQIKKRIRYLAATEVRQRMSEPPGHLDNEPREVQEAWEQTIWDIAKSIWPEDKKPPGELSSIDPSTYRGRP